MAYPAELRSMIPRSDTQRSHSDLSKIRESRYFNVFWKYKKLCFDNLILYKLQIDIAPSLREKNESLFWTNDLYILLYT